MIYLLGDVHGDWRKITYLCKHLTKNDIVIQLGDHGINYYGTGQDDHLKKKIAKLNCTFIFITGNHDRRAEHFKNYSLVDIDIKDTIKGKFYYNGHYPNQYFCPMYSLFEVCKKTFLNISGSYSVDKYYRIMNGWNWFEDEQLSINEQNDILEKIEIDNVWKNPDYVLTHTCPLRYQPTHLFLNGIDQSKVDITMEKFLNIIEKKINYKHWVLGHYHATERLWEKGLMLFEDLISLKELENE